MPEEEISVTALTVYIKQQLTMKQHELRVSGFMASLRPALPLPAKNAVLEAFASLNPSPEGHVRLGDWLARSSEESLRKTAVMAFGFDDEAACEDMPITEEIFLEFFSDLAPLTDLGAVLPGPPPP